MKPFAGYNNSVIPTRLALSIGTGRVGIDWGVYGVPETFVIGADGVVRYKHIGPVTHESLTWTKIHANCSGNC